MRIVDGALFNGAGDRIGFGSQEYRDFLSSGGTVEVVKSPAPSITVEQLKKQLNVDGARAIFEERIVLMPLDVQDLFSVGSTVVLRMSPTTIAMQQQLGWTDLQVDQFFAKARFL